MQNIWINTGRTGRYYEKQLPKEKKLKEAPEVVIAKAVGHMMKKDRDDS